jgi:hypothetical protein
MTSDEKLSLDEALKQSEKLNVSEDNPEQNYRAARPYQTLHSHSMRVSR